MKVIALSLLVCALVAVCSGAPQQKQDNKTQGEVAVDVNRDHHRGTNFRIDGRQEVFTSNDGRTRGEVYGNYQRTWGGTYDGQRSHTVGGRVSHSWGKK